MNNKISRREFVKKGVAAGSTLVAGSIILPGLTFLDPQLAEAAVRPDLAVVKGSNFFQNTIKAIQQLGGMETFVNRGSRVGLLINSPFKNYGAHTRPDISLAIAKMCYDAGAKEILLLKEEYDGYWDRCTLKAEYSDMIKSLKPGYDDFIDHTIKGSIKLDEPSITKDVLDCDVFINAAIIKHHSGVEYTCTIKNMMGVASTPTNMGMHFGGKVGLSYFPDLEYTTQCIVDLNTIREPDLCVVDTTEFIIEKGPYGPGKLAKPHLVVAGTDRVALDAYCSSVMGLDPSKLLLLQKAADQGLGNANLNQLNISEIIA